MAREEGGERSLANVAALVLDCGVRLAGGCGER